ncbi:uncharacterized protein LOC143039356 isoform X1 [Oratosquilla oratoria]|uniref:uncharacterized protein LOC143039356 isoform X1 n=1 Tax=Oratosquilla oratoria TaxID=337810 RepID=UPI003F75B58E
MAWLNVIQVPQLFKKSAQDLNRSYRLCSRHFSPKNYTNGTTSSRLLQNALPDQNLNCVATSPPISSSITPTDSNGEVASQASKCNIKPGIDYKSAPELPVAISYLQYMESGFGSLKHAIEDDSHAYTDLNHRQQNTSDQNAEPTEEEQQQQQQPCTTVEDAASKATNHSTNPCKNEKRLKSADLLNNCRKRINRLIKK